MPNEMIGLPRRVLLAVAIATLAPEASLRLSAQALDPITYTIRVPEPDAHLIEVETIVPTMGRASIEMMMPVWSPGYCRVEDYAANVRDLEAEGANGQSLIVERPDSNHWRIRTAGARSVRLFYRVFCNQRSVTTNYVDREYGVLNGAPTFITLAETARRPHEVRIELPSTWTRAMSGLDDLPGEPTGFRAIDYETLVDSPILAGALGVREFAVDGKEHYLVSVGDTEGWDGERATRDLAAFVQENHRFWGFLPYEKYLFLMMFRPGGGGLEHKNSNLSTVRAGSTVSAGSAGSAGSADSAGSGGRWVSLGLEAHEYFHLFNAKRLRPVELGPFDFEKAPTTGSLWISEGVTSYYSGLLMTRSALQTQDEYLASLSNLIAGLQNAPGRLLQSVERSSLEVWNNSNSGVNPNATTVSYYNKGNLLGLLLDARIRRMTDGRKSFDDVMRLAYQRFGGERGFTSDEFRMTAETVAGGTLREWFSRSVSSTEELDYADLLEWYGLQFVSSTEKAGNWKLQVRPQQTEAQRKNLQAWLAPSSR